MVEVSKIVLAQEGRGRDYKEKENVNVALKYASGAITLNASGGNCNITINKSQNVLYRKLLTVEIFYGNLKVVK